MFQLIRPSSGQIKNTVQNIVLVVQCALTECTSRMFCVWPDGGTMSRNMSPNF